MALSGSNYKSFARHRLVAEWTATQNVASNQSTVTVKVFLQSVDGYGAMSAPASNAGSVKVGTTTKNFTATSQLRANQKKQLTSQSFVVSHNANGTASFNYSVTYNINVTFAGVFYGNQTVSGSGTLNTIPRASSIASIVGNQIGGNVTVNITRASSSFKHIVKYTNTAGNVVTVGENVDTSKTFTISINDCSHLPNSTSGTAKITVDTYSGNSKIGSVTSNHTVYVPDSVKPTFEWVTIKELTDSIKSLNLGENRFVQGKSNLQMQVHGTAPYGATINKASVGITHVHTIQSHIGSISLASFPWAVGENLQLVGTITDSRGRSASGSIGFTILPFSNPVIHSFSASRINNGTSISVFKRIGVSRVDVNRTGYAVYVDRKINGGWTQIHYETSTNAETITLNGFDIASSHELRLRIDDYFQSVSSMTTISTSKTLMDFNKDIGVGIGKVHEKGALDVGGDAHIAGNYHSLKGTVNWTPVAQGTPVYTHLYRNSGETLGALYHSVGDDTLALNIYTKAGGFKIHKFGNDGTLNIGGQILENGTRVSTKTHGEVTPTYPDANFAPYNTTYSSDQHPKVYHRNNNVVTISGAITNKVIVGSGWSGRIALIPEWARPRNTVNFITQGSGNSTLLLTIASNGDVNMTRYRDGSADIATPIGSWININCTYVIPL